MIRALGKVIVLLLRKNTGTAGWEMLVEIVRRAVRKHAGIDLSSVCGSSAFL